MKTYIVTETGKHSSLDPLEADAKQNLPVARMVYLTPLEMGSNERLVSSILDSFQYSKKDREITWSVRKGLRFDDGSPITVEDVAFSVIRMAYSRPKFPVIKEIEGVETWAKSNGALLSHPSGIAVQGNTIRIKFSEDVEHPFFRFALELFSIIPKKCVDISTNKLTCPSPPASGYYKIANQSHDAIVFERRKEFPRNIQVPSIDLISFKYIKPLDILTPDLKLDEDFVIAANETYFSKEQMKRIEEKYLLRSLPKSSFAVISLSPKAEYFEDRECRTVFMEKFRDELVEAGMEKVEVDGSLTTQILPGYLPLAELKRRASPVSEKKRSECENILRKAQIDFGVWSGSRFPVPELALSKTLKYFGQNAWEPKVFSTRELQADEFVSGKTPILFGASGFWPQDPFGDLQMLFTPNLHKVLQFISNDKKLQKTIEQLRKPLPATRRRVLAEDFNVYIYEQGLFGIYRHTKRFYLSSKSKAQTKLPLALTAPSPWQVFE